MAEVSNSDQADSVTLDSDQKCVKVRISVRHADADIHALVDKAIDGIVYARRKLESIGLSPAPLGGLKND